jgi:hypothetical protein
VLASCMLPHRENATSQQSLRWAAAKPMWVHKRGHFGRKASAVLRSAYPIILGVGGWLLGALIVLATMPSVPVDDELMVALSVGLPVGLGICLAWMHRDWSAESKGIGLAASVAGALVGGWVGFHATAGLMALVTAILGARRRCQHRADLARHGAAKAGPA